MSVIDRNTLAAVLAIIGIGVIGVGALHSRDAIAQAKPSRERVRAKSKAALKQALTVDVGTLEAQARAAWDAVREAQVTLAAAEAAVAAATPGTAEYDDATEAWIKAQGIVLTAQEGFSVAQRALEEGRALRGAAVTAFVEDRCANDDGKDVDIKKICDRVAAAKAEEAAREAAATARTRGEFVPPPGAALPPAQP